MSDVLHVCFSQTKMSAARTTAAASTSASTQWALTFVSVAMALYCMRTNMTVRKVGFTYIHISTYTGIKTVDHTCTWCHITTSMSSCTRTVIVHHTATLFIHIRVPLTTEWPFPFEKRVSNTYRYFHTWRLQAELSTLNLGTCHCKLWNTRDKTFGLGDFLDLQLGNIWVLLGAQNSHVTDPELKLLVLSRVHSSTKAWQLN